MMGEEFVWRISEKPGDDPDGDGVTRELSVGDITAMTVYTAGQETPTPIGRLAELGSCTAPDAATTARINTRQRLFAKIGCTTCHVPEMRLKTTIFEEPTLARRRQLLRPVPGEQGSRLRPEAPGEVRPGEGRGGAARGSRSRRRRDRAAVWRSEASRHGPAPRRARRRRRRSFVELAPLEWNGKVALIAPSVFLTAELWGVGNTGPYLHDDRAGTLARGHLVHGEDSPPAAAQPGAARRRNRATRT